MMAIGRASLLCLLCMAAPLLTTAECPAESAFCTRRCHPERTAPGWCPGGGVCCLRPATPPDTSHYIRKWLAGVPLPQEEEDDRPADYSFWSYLRNRSLGNPVPERSTTERWVVHLGIELPVDMQTDAKETAPPEVVYQDVEVEGPAGGDTMENNSWTRFMHFLYNKSRADREMNARSTVFDCGDAEDRLRCKRSCPERLRVLDKTCPFNRFCCRGTPSSIYTPLRQSAFYETDHQQDQVFNYLINQWNQSDPVRVVNIEEESNDIYPPPPRPPTSETLSNNAEDNSIVPEEALRKSAKFCKKYQELTVEYLHAMPLLSEVIPFTLPMDNCIPLFMPLIVGGQNVTRGEFPHMAAIGYYKDGFTDYLCGGTLISNKYILTAAHCAHTKWGPPVTVMLGSTLLYAEDGVDFGVKRAVIHPDYQPPSYYHDIALLELDREVEFSQTLRPACLALPGSDAQEPGSVAIATGWGKTGFARQSSLQLKKVPLKVIANNKCEEYYTSDIRQPPLREGLDSKLLCASGHASEYHDTCQGDSGGPLQAFLPGHNCMLEVVAVTSFGKTCGTAIPGVYTKIEPYISWIEDIVWP